MNTPNNKRRRESIEKIEKTFMQLLQTCELNEITVSDICKITGLNRSTFYANFVDIYDLAGHLRRKLETDFDMLFESNPDARGGSLMMFRHIYENQILYKTYFKLGYHEQLTVLPYDTRLAEQEFGSTDLIKYHIEFFRCGLNAMIKMWLSGGCQESPEEMDALLRAEYRGRREN